MKRFFKVSLYFLLFILVLFLQFKVIGANNIFGIKPNLILSFIIVLSFKNNIYLSSILSLLIGLYVDSIYLNELLIYTIVFTLISLLIGVIKEKVNFSDVFSSVLPIIISLFIYNIINYGYFAIYTSTYFSFIYFIIYNVISVSINLVISLIIYNIYDKIDSISVEKKNYWKA